MPSVQMFAGEGAIIGCSLKRRGRRDDVVIATKVGMGPDHKTSTRASIAAAAEDSLRRLQKDYIDLYQSHRDDESTPLGETLEACRLLVDQGKVRAIGASNYTAGRLAEALAVSDAKGLPRYQSLQPEYNLMGRASFEGELRDAPIASATSLAQLDDIAGAARLRLQERHVAALDTASG